MSEFPRYEPVSYNESPSVLFRRMQEYAVALDAYMAEEYGPFAVRFVPDRPSSVNEWARRQSWSADYTFWLGAAGER